MTIEQIVLEYLTGQVSVPVYCEVPESKPPEYIVIEKTGENWDQHIRTAMIAVQSYAVRDQGKSLLAAANTNEAVINAMVRMAETENVFSCYLNSSYNYTDTQTKEYRYQSVFNISY